MKTFRVTLAVSIALAVCWTGIAQAISLDVTIDTVPVGNLGNTGDTTGYGAVSTAYRIGTTEVTNTQYTAFLNAVAATDTHSLYSTSMGSDTNGGINRTGSPSSYTYSVKADAGSYTYANKPVIYVSFWDATRFSNWLHNGQGSGDTETGAYTLTTDGITNNTVTRNAGATWFLPSENEWYKAAYHKNDGDTANYWDYPTSSDTAPNNNLPTSDTGNSANFFSGGELTTGDIEYVLTDAGAYGDSESPYGTYDQGGNVFEWNETIIDTSDRGLRGGDFFSFGSTALKSSSTFNFDDPSFDSDNVGFRVASIIPEPSALLLVIFASVFALLWRRRLS